MYAGVVTGRRRGVFLRPRCRHHVDRHGRQYGLEFFAGWLTEYINGGEHVHVPEIPTLLSLAVIVVTLVITTVVASLYKTRVGDKG